MERFRRLFLTPHPCPLDIYTANAVIYIKISKNYTAPKHSATQLLFARYARSVRPLCRLTRITHLKRFRSARHFVSRSTQPNFFSALKIFPALSDFSWVAEKSSRGKNLRGEKDSFKIVRFTNFPLTAKDPQYLYSLTSLKQI